MRGSYLAAVVGAGVAVAGVAGTSAVVGAGVVSIGPATRSAAAGTSVVVAGTCASAGFSFLEQAEASAKKATNVQSESFFIIEDP